MPPRRSLRRYRKPSTTPKTCKAALYDEIHRLYRKAGEPSTRKIAEKAEKIISHTTICNVIRHPNDKQSWLNWTNVEPIIKALGGDVEFVHELWSKARDEEDDKTTGEDNKAADEHVTVRPGTRIPAPRPPPGAASEDLSENEPVTLGIWEHPDLPILKRWLVRLDDAVLLGQPIALLETSPVGQFEFTAPCSGIIVAFGIEREKEIFPNDIIVIIRRNPMD